MSGIRKSFGSTRALRGVELQVRPGEVHALIGENGAGKSTLMKVLSGAVKPDAGSIDLDGKLYSPAGPKQARALGVAMIYQELTLAPDLTVEANVLLGLESSDFGFLQAAENRRRVREALSSLEHPEIEPDAPVAALGAGARQLVEIARALLVDVKVLVLDEPTSALTREDVDRLFKLVRRLRDRGVSIIYISHFLEEVEEIADRFTVLRDGESVASGSVADFSRDSIIEQMVGRNLSEQFPRISHSIGEPILTVSGLSGVDLPHDVNLTLHRGEILGIAGIVGAGRTELLRAIFGLNEVRSGEVKIKTVSSRRASPASRIREGVGLLSEDRKSEGLTLDQSIIDNLTYSRLSPYTMFGILNLGRRHAAAANWLHRLNVRYSDADQSVGELSGGNQQKVAIGRLLHQEADVLLLDEPTKGVDIGSKAEIYRLIGELAAQGKAILFISSYLPELLGVCDRLAVMCRGRLGEIRPVANWTPEQVMTAAVGST